MEYNDILIVDDSSTSRMIIKRCFEIAGFDTSKFHFAENGLEALGVLEKNCNIDLIVTDLNMPKMDGENFIRKIKMNDLFRNKSILVISSIGNTPLEEELKKLGIRGIIKKPISPASIVQVMGEGL